MFQPIGTKRTKVAAALAGTAILIGACSGGSSQEASPQGSNAARTETASSLPNGSLVTPPAAQTPTQEGSPEPDPSAAETGASPSSATSAPLPAAKGPASAPKSSAAAASPAGSAPTSPAPATGSAKALPGAVPAPSPKPGAPGPGGATDVGVTDREIKVGSINMHGLPLANVLIDPQVRGMQASVQAINDAGGVHGRNITFIDCDDGPGDTARAKACMKKLAEQDKVFAMLTSTTWSSAAIHDDLAKYQLPLVGAWAYSVTEWSDPWMFPTHMPMLHEAYAAAEWVRDVIKPKTFGLICLNSPEMQKACGNVNEVLTKAGAKLVHQSNLDLTPTDTSSEVVAMRAANPDHIIHYVINPATIVKFVVQAAQQQYWPPKGLSGNHLATEVLGSLFGQWPVNRYWTNTTYKLWGPEFMAVMAKYAPKNRGINHHIVQAGYVGTNNFAEAAKKVGPNLTRKALMDVLNSQEWNAGPGLDQKFMYTPGQRNRADTGNRTEYMYKYTDANTTGNRDGSAHGFVPDPDRFVITDHESGGN
ncbi:MAG TPA: ABC transporter substrate-binding protein [Acidimicrobiia bacterium]|jgi:ABC-type branched-subunit amino acid transport system substrate-binding protein|nr:ABC transporter substrate-binding protein [Acidimicrobiia bacterium]